MPPPPLAVGYGGSTSVTNPDPWNPVPGRLVPGRLVPGRLVPGRLVLGRPVPAGAVEVAWTLVTGVSVEEGSLDVGNMYAELIVVLGSVMVTDVTGGSEIEAGLTEAG